MPQLGSKEPPLKANDKLVVGCGREDGLAFGWSSGHKVDITYIKIFVARDRTDFSSIMQRYDSVIEDKLRGWTLKPNYSKPLLILYCSCRYFQDIGERFPRAFQRQHRDAPLTVYW
jgi:hypothetical protein